MNFKHILYTTAVTVGLSFLYTTDVEASETISSIKQFKTEVHANLKKYNSSFELKYDGDMSEFQREIRKVIPGLIDTDDMIAGTLKEYTSRIVTTQDDGKVTYKVDYFTTKEKDKKANALIAKEVAKIKKVAKTDYDKVKAVNDFIVRNTTYGGRSGDRYTTYGLMADRAAVCQGYALVAYQMLNSLSVPTRYVVGVSHDQDHAWNKVKVSGSWYNLDTTWNDPLPNSPTEVSYNYFLLSDKQMKKDHAWVEENYPSSKKSTYDFLAKTSSMVQVGTKMYYANSADNERLYMYDTKTKKHKKLSNTRVQYLVSANNKLYFSNYSNGAYLSSISTNGKSLKTLNKKNSMNLEVKGKYIYYKSSKKTYKYKIK